MMSNCGLDVLEYKSVTLNPHHNFGVYCSGRDFDMILEQPKFRSQTHLKSGFKKNTDAHNPRFPTHKKGARCARASLNLEVLSLTLTTTSEF